MTAFEKYKPGHCHVCGECLFEVLTTYPFDHKWSGIPKTLGLPLDKALRVTLLLIDGNRIQITMCDTCVDGLTQENLKFIYRNILLGWKAEIGDEAEKYKWFSDKHRQFLLGVVCEEYWMNIG